MAEVREADQIAHDYYAMGYSVSLINDIIAGNAMDGEEDVDKKARVDRNVRHLEFMLAKDDWGNESMTASSNAVAAGKAYIG